MISIAENIVADCPATTKPTLKSTNWAGLADSLYLLLIRLLTGSIIIALCLWMLMGTLVMLIELGQVLHAGWRMGAEHMIINSLMMLAFLEIIRTLQAYLKLGRVRVTFIIDTALVVLIGELMGLWFKQYTPEKLLLGLGAIITLVVLRIITSRYSLEAPQT